MKRIGLFVLCGVLFVGVATVVDNPLKRLWEKVLKTDPSAENSSTPVTSVSAEKPLPIRPTIRVNVSSVVKRGRLPTIAVDGPYLIRRLRDGRELSRGNRLATSSVSGTSSNLGLTTGLQIGRQTFAVSAIEIVPQPLAGKQLAGKQATGKLSPKFWVGTHQYRGSLRMIRNADRSILFVNVVPLEQYLASVVNGEMPANFPAEARQAQIIAARTYALFEMQHSRNNAFDLYSTTRSQMYLGVQYRDANGRLLAGETAESRELVRQTLGLVCKSGGKIFHTYYSAVCGGRTLQGTEMFRDAKAPFASVGCEWCRPAKRYRWTVSLKHTTVSTALQRYFRAQRKPFGALRFLQSQKIKQQQTEQGRLPIFIASDGRNRHLISGATLRSLLGTSRLPSSVFTVRMVAVRGQNPTIEFQGRGYGHGVGMCQWGAAGLAKTGKTAAEILRHYYRGITIERFNR